MAEDNERGDGPPRDVDAAAYWRANLKLIAVLLGVWAVVSYVFGSCWSSCSITCTSVRCLWASGSRSRAPSTSLSC